MDIEFISLLMDGVVLAALMIAIFFAISISRTLNNFKQARSEMGRQIAALNASLDQAENTLKSLKVESLKTGDDLKAMINQGRDVLGELQVMHRSGDNLANRLEGVIDAGNAKVKPAPKKHDFAISDKEAARKQSGGKAPAFATKAEQDLYDALQANKKQNKRG